MFIELWVEQNKYCVMQTIYARLNTENMSEINDSVKYLDRKM